MAEERLQRRLAGIFAADVVGYSRLVGADEAGTLGALKELRARLVDPNIAEHRGRIFKTTGDGLLAEFPSVVDAVACAVEIQKGIALRNADLPEDRLIQLRIGVHLGDVIIEGDDVFGDGVNVAARLEGIAPPGGLVVSAMVRDNIGNRLEIEFEDLGERTLKNIERPVRIYAVRLNAQCFAVRGSGDGNIGRLAPSLPDKPSIAVLPFVNMSGDPEQEFFTDGLTEDIITDIANVPGFFVIARNSTFAYKGKPADVRQISHDLGVKYILEGSARRSDKRLRVTAQLIDAAGGGNHIWAERFDRELADIFAVQDEVTRRVVESIVGKIGVHSIPERYRPSSLEAYELCVRCRDKWAESISANDHVRSNAERAIALDPNYCEAHWQLAYALIFGWVFWGYPQVPNRAKALLHAQRAVELDPNDSGARLSLGYVLLFERRWDEAEFQYDTAVRLNPNNADAYTDLSEFYRLTGKPHRALESVAKAMRLNPRPPGWYYWTEGVAQIAAGQFEKAVITLRREETYQTGSRYQLAAVLALLGRTSEAQAEARLFHEASPHWRISTWLENQPFKNPADANFLIEAFRLAGLPE